MIEEQGRVVALEAGAVWVQTIRQSTCQSCSAKAGCGQGLMQRLGVGQRHGYVRCLTDDASLQVDDDVVIGVPEDAVVKSSMLVYLLPLLALLAGAVAGEAWGELASVLLAGLAFAIALLVVRWYDRRHADDPALQPVVLRALLARSLH
ncbi:positive regulator of sigma(E), RseC/MucC [Atopomonas hussainii]|uniref:Positive regulator of sigma(E), RseC/MucC n=1 Tax=Atopomonas hussainii TaxID=1429083 RepID=A0A1H7K5F5_9GAMM|nr:SoxR reducing system RseC family protein [Atopomonas hussainii]SEK81716.1 positive regulator of sigma(E), RseC/MucC [Atopomonas hussainii]